MTIIEGHDAFGAAPEEGQLVRVRDRHWIVARATPSSVPADGTTLPKPPTMVDLVSVEDDDVHPDLRVIWEVEPGTRVLETATLPRPVLDQLDDPARLDAFLDAVRWGAITSAESTALQAPFRSGIEIQTYQLDPLVRALRAPRVNLLIADDVGLGKTIEAGLVAQELLLRHRARSMLVVCPAGLTTKWQSEMLEKFGLDFTIVDDALIRQLRRERGVGANAFTYFPRLIISIDRLKRGRYMKIMRDAIAGADPSQYPRRFDLLIVDEVHQCAPSGRGQYAIDSQRTKTIEELSLHFEHRLFLSATPHNGYQESFTALLELLDPQRFARGVPPAREAVEQVMVRRLKRELQEQLKGTADAPRFPQRKIVELEIEPSADERRMHTLIDEYSASRRKSSGSKTTQVANRFVTLLLKKRLLSSPEAFARTLGRHRESMGSASARADVDVEDLYDDIELDYDDDEAKLTATDDAERAASRALEPLSEDQEAILAELGEIAERARKRSGAKLDSLLEFLFTTCMAERRGKQAWNRERVIVFTEYRDTLFWIHEQLTARLSAKGIDLDGVELIHGGTRIEDRERLINQFQTDPSEFPVRVLLATDAASEGIDLQRQCHRIVHFETPFSPNRLEQRNGRVDRHGQPSPVALIHHFVPAGFQDAPRDSLEGDLQFLRLVALKVEQIRDDLGSAGDVLADRVQRRLGGGENVDLSAPPPKRKRDSTELVKLRRDLERDLHRLREALDESVAELGITPETVRRVVEAGLQLARQPALIPTRLRRKDGDIDVFEVPSLSGTWLNTVSDLPHPAHPLTTRRPITFDHAIVEGHDDVVLVHLGHRLAQRAMRLLRAEIWASTEDRALSRVTARIVDSDELDGPALIAHARLVVTGGTGARLHEQVISAGGQLVDGRFRAFTTVREVNELLAAASDVAAPAAATARVVAAWDSAERGLFSAIEQRGRAVRDSILRRLETQRVEQRDAIENRMNDLRAAIEARLHELEGANVQLQLDLNPEEQAQWQSDREALRDRLTRIPQEILDEQRNIDVRFATPTDRVFPAAVTILVPATAARTAG